MHVCIHGPCGGGGGVGGRDGVACCEGARGDPAAALGACLAASSPATPRGFVSPLGSVLCCARTAQDVLSAHRLPLLVAVNDDQHQQSPSRAASRHQHAAGDTRTFRRTCTRWVQHWLQTFNIFENLVQRCTKNVTWYVNSKNRSGECYRNKRNYNISRRKK